VVVIRAMRRSVWAAFCGRWKWRALSDRRQYGPAGDDEDGYFGERVASRYDESSADMVEPGVVAPIVDLLAGLAGSGRALELAVGTGRIALPLAERGVEAHGIDMSRAMVCRLRANPGGDTVGVTIGDFATTEVAGTFSVVYLVFNTIMNLTTQDAQVACFRDAAARLGASRRPGGLQSSAGLSVGRGGLPGRDRVGFLLRLSGRVRPTPPRIQADPTHPSPPQNIRLRQG
jgi:hypothetical protein